MDREYQPLPIRELGEGAGYRRPTQPQVARVTLESPALEVMTDLQRASPATIRPQAPVEGANQYMLSRGVRLLLVVDESDSVLGVVTATDVWGASLRVVLELGVPRASSGDIMTPARQVGDRAGRHRGRARGPRAGRWWRTASTRWWWTWTCCPESLIDRRARDGAGHTFAVAARAPARRAAAERGRGGAHLLRHRGRAGTIAHRYRSHANKRFALRRGAPYGACSPE
jgi:hypothetical protein